MEVKDYCRSIEVELHGWKAKMYDMVRKVDKLRGTEKENVASQVEELHNHISDMERIIAQLQTECPVEFGYNVAAGSHHVPSAHQLLYGVYQCQGCGPADGGLPGPK